MPLSDVRDDDDSDQIAMRLLSVSHREERASDRMAIYSSTIKDVSHDGLSTIFLLPQLTRMKHEPAFEYSCTSSIETFIETFADEVYAGHC